MNIPSLATDDCATKLAMIQALLLGSAHTCIPSSAAINMKSSRSNVRYPTLVTEMSSVLMIRWRLVQVLANRNNRKSLKALRMLSVLLKLLSSGLMSMASSTTLAICREMKFNGRES